MKQKQQSSEKRTKPIKTNTLIRITPNFRDIYHQQKITNRNKNPIETAQL